MNEPYFILIAGNGASSRANTEALMEDYYYAHGENGTLVIAYKGGPTKSQTVAAQYAKDKNKDILVFCTKNAMTAGIPSATVSESDDPFASAFEFISGKKAWVFNLYNEDETNTAIMAQSAEKGFEAFDLTNGLLPMAAVMAQNVPSEPLAEEEEALPLPPPPAVVTEKPRTNLNQMSARDEIVHNTIRQIEGLLGVLKEYL
jgi:hypothetical protein